MIAAVFAVGIAGCGTQASIDTGTQAGHEGSGEAGGRYSWPHDVETIEQDMSRLRGLPIDSEIKVTYLSREELAAKIAEEEAGSPVAPGDVAAQEKLLKVLGLLAPDANLAEEGRAMLGEGIEGFYDDNTKELTVISNSRRFGVHTISTISHEVTHALQDQHFDLKTVFPDEGTGNSDRDLARQALIEGDATLAMDKYMNRLVREAPEPGGNDFIQDREPLYTYLEDQLDFPYSFGEKFVTTLSENGGWDSVNAAFGKLPESTEQIMHPRKYFSDEQPQEIDIPDLTEKLGAGWRLVDDDYVGEFDVMELFMHQMSSGKANAAAAGWGGGRYQLYQRADGAILYLMSLKWDSEDDRGEFFDAMKISLEKRYGAQFAVTGGAAGGGAPLLGTPDGSWLVESDGESVVVVLAPDESLARSSVVAACADCS